MEATAAIVEVLLASMMMVVIVVTKRNIFVIDELHNTTEHCGVVLCMVFLLGIIVKQNIQTSCCIVLLTG